MAGQLLRCCTALHFHPCRHMGTDWVGQSQHTLFPALAHRVGIFWDEWHCQDTAWVSPSQCFNLLQSSKLPSDARIVRCICTSFSQGPMVASPSSILCQTDKGRQEEMQQQAEEEPTHCHHSLIKRHSKTEAGPAPLSQDCMDAERTPVTSRHCESAVVHSSLRHCFFASQKTALLKVWVLLRCKTQGSYRIW